MINRSKLIHSLQSLRIFELFSRAARRNRFLGACFKAVSQAILPRRLPHRIRIDPCRACNLNCFMCASRKGNKPDGCMDYELFKKIIDECSHHGARTFNLCKDGEPLLNPRIVDMIHYIKKANSNNIILLTTNGILLNEDISRQILNGGIDKITISIRAASEEQYKKLSGKEGLALVEENTKRFIRLKKELGLKKPDIYLQFIEFKHLSAEKEAFTAKWKDLDVDLVIEAPLGYSGVIKEAPAPKINDSERYPCYCLWSTFSVNWDGTVSACYMDYDMDNIVGDMKRHAPEAVWAGAEMERYRDLHLKGEYSKIPMCRDCDIWLCHPDIFFGWQKKKKT